LLLTGNRGAADFRATNGELVKVRDVDGGRIHLEDGRTLPVNYHEFDHGYAVTAHRSQGKTVDAVILSADAMKQELFYVGASRGRQEIVVVTSDREQLRNLLGVSTARPSATELAREQAQHHPAPMRSPERPPLQALEPPLLRKKDGHRRNLGMGR
jgi:ATP-dependent exoDNAse (exonuclease V) alpha subunit